jgi:hypothetical protein
VKNYERAGENCIMQSFITIFFTKYYWYNQIKAEEIEYAIMFMKDMGNSYKNLV